MKLAIFIIPLLALTSFLCNNNSVTENKNHEVLKQDSAKQFILTEKQQKILDGAKKCLRDKFSYDMQMAYHELNYKDGIKTGKSVYPMGDMEPSLGVCVEITIRALRYAGIVDLQQAIHEDIKLHWVNYPMIRWGANSADANIDHRRVPNQHVWFKKYWNEIAGDDWEPGDIIEWDMDGDSWGDHIGIISDRLQNGRLCVIHNFPSPGYVAEEDVQNRWKIIGHFRVKG